MSSNSSSKREAVNLSRTVEQVVAGMKTSDGAGVKLVRVLTHNLQRRLDPFLMMDVFRSDDPDDYIAGFPSHPHRGFETITYMVAGRMRHRDSAGNEKVLENGGVQWMTAGKGVIHSEMPEQEDGLMEGIQLWLNLPARDKMSPVWYQDISAGDLPTFTTDGGVRVIVIAGDSNGVKARVNREVTQPLYLDITLPAGGRFEQHLDAGLNAFVYVYSGEAFIAGKGIPETRMAILTNDSDADGVVIEAGEKPTRVMLIAGKPLNEPIAQYGPFVMNTQEEIYAAVNDYRAGRFE